MKKNVYIFVFLLGLFLSPKLYGSAYIYSGAKFYLDVHSSSVWRGYGYISARFSGGTGAETEVPMTRVLGEDGIWEVTVPSPATNTDKYISFYAYANSTDQYVHLRPSLDTIFPLELEWDGKKSLYAVQGKGIGYWTYFLPNPTVAPSSLVPDSTITVRLCPYYSSHLHLALPSYNSDNVGFQWYHNNPTTGKWTHVTSETHIVNPPVSPSTTTEGYFYYIEKTIKSNQVINGNFDHGYLGFTTPAPFTLVSGQINDKEFTIAPTTNGLRPPSSSIVVFYDHTSGSGSGNMLAFNGAGFLTTDIPVTVWEQNIPATSITPDVDYEFSFWVSVWTSVDVPQLEVSINDVVIGGKLEPVATCGQWTKFSVEWHAPSSPNPAKISLKNYRLSRFGNGFVIDDVSFGEITQKTYLYHYIFDIENCYSDINAERCVVLPDNQTDLQQLITNGIVDVKYMPLTSTTMIPITPPTAIDNYVQIYNAIGESDAIVTNLQTIDTGFISSMRIGNYTILSPLAHEIEVTTEINLNPSHPIVNFHIASVLTPISTGSSISDPIPDDILNHHYLKIEFIDNKDRIIDNKCLNINITEWKRVTKGKYYMPWKSISFDMSDYILSDIKKIRFTQFAQYANFYSYSYVSAKCIKKEIIHTTYCGEFPEPNTISLFAPEGFEYAWFRGNGGIGVGSMSTAQTTQNYYTNEKNQEYTLSYWTPGADTLQCYHNLHFASIARYPIADLEFITTTDACGDKIGFIDKSFVATTKNGIDAITGESTRIGGNMPDEQCDRIKWKIESDDAGYTEEFYLYTRDTFYRYFPKAGNYKVTVIAGLSNCSHIKEVTFTITNPKKENISYTYKDICEGNFYNFKGRHIYTSGEYSYDTIAENGCDSTIILILTTHKPYHFYEYDTIHYNSDITDATTHPILQKYSITDIYGGHYETNLQTTLYKCDSIYTLFLYVYPHKVYSTDVTICENDLPYIWHGKSYPTLPTTYSSTTTITAIQNYFERDTDFTETLNLTIIPTKDKLENHYICDGQAVDINGKTITNDTSFYDIGFNTEGCTVKTYHIVHKEVPIKINHGTITICRGDVYEWNIDGTTYNLSTEGRHEHTRPSRNVSNCDTVIYLFLSFLPVHENFKQLSVCPGDSTPPLVDGKRYPLGDYYLKGKNQFGCDSFVRYRVRNIEYVTRDINVSMCENKPMIINGQIVTKTDKYSDTLISSTGCRDSIINYDITVRPIHIDTTRIHVCKGEESYTIRDGIVVHVGHSTMTEYRDTVFDYYGCDSIHVFLITQGINHVREETRTICEGDSIPWLWSHYPSKYYKGSTPTYFKTEGVYTDTVPKAHSYDCDTIYILNLRKAPVVVSKDTAYICSGDSIYIEGVWYRDEGTITKHSRSRAGCDSIINLTIRYKSTYHYLLKDTVCEGDVYTFNGRDIIQPVGDAVYHNDYTSASGCDSIYELHLHVNRSFDTLISETICNGDYYQLGDRYLYRTGIYTYDCVSPSTGCDSMTRLSLMVMPNFVSETLRVYLCDDSIYKFHKFDATGDTILRTPGIYSCKGKTQYGCDSITTIEILRAHSYYKEDTVNICQGERYNFLGKEYDKTDIYYDSARTRIGQCDSMHVLHLIVHPVWTKDTIKVHVCGASRYMVKGLELLAPTTYVDSNYSVYGCDSLVTYIINRGDQFLYEDVPLHLCAGETLKWKSPWKEFEITKAGTYSDTFHVSYEDKTIHSDEGRDSLSGCDSIFRVQVYEVPQKKTSINTTICPSDSIYFAGKKIRGSDILKNRKRDSIYYDTLTSYPYGCKDSIVQLHVFLHYDYYHEYEETVCKTDKYLFNGRYINFSTTTKDTIYIDKYPTVNGCDSVFVLTLHVLDTNVVYKNETICSDSMLYYFGDTILTTTGTYRYTTKNREFCDSTTILHLTVMPNHIETSEVVYLCKGNVHKNYHPAGSKRDEDIDTVIYKAGIYRRHFPSRYGCDSIHIIDVRTVPKYYQYDTVHICRGEQYVFHDVVCDSKKTDDYTYADTTRIGGCDSIHYLHLVVDTVYKDTTHITLCPSSAFYIKNKRLFPPCEYADSNLTVHGCDSIRWYIVKEGHSNITDTTVTICDGEYFDWIPRKGATPRRFFDDDEGVHDDTLKRPNGQPLNPKDTCWEIARLNLRVSRVKYTTIQKTICPTDSIYFNREYRSNVGKYRDTIPYLSTNNHLCDSIIELQITHYPQYYFEKKDTICDNEYYEYNGRRIYKERLDTKDTVCVDSFYTMYQCDSIYTLNLHIAKTDTVYKPDTICEGMIYQLGDTILTTTGTYTYVSPNKKSTHCDSTTTVHLVVRQKQYRDSFVNMCSGEIFHLSDELKADTPITNAGTYIRRYTSHYGCDSVVSYHVNFYPSPRRRIEVNICKGDVYRLSNGQYVSEPRIYPDTVKTEHGCDSITEIDLRVKPSYHDTTRMRFCQKGNVKIRENLIINLDTVETSIEHIDTFIAKSGCDSFVTYIISIANNVQFSSNIHRCQGQTFIWDDTKKLYPYGRNHKKLIGDADVYFDTAYAQHPNHCDTIYTLNVITHPIYNIEYTTTICPSDYIYIGVNKISDEGIYTINDTSSCGCDSTIIRHVHHYKEYYEEKYQSICDGDSFVFSYNTWNEQGIPSTYKRIYRQGTTDIIKARTHNGCDSIIRLTLSINSVHRDTFRHYLCPNETYILHDTIIFKATDAEKQVYCDTMTSVSGCDSIEVHIFIGLPHYLIDTIVTTCANSPFVWTGHKVKGEINDRILTLPGIYYDSLKTEAGCDSVYRLTLYHKDTKYVQREIYICAGDSFDLLNNGQEMAKVDDIYINTIPSSNGCDSTIETRLHVREPFFKEENIDLCENDSLRMNTRIVFGNNFKKLYGSTTHDFYDSLLTKEGLCDSVYLYHIKLKTVSRDTIEVLLCPNTSYVIRDNIVLHTPENQESYTYYDTLTSINSCDSINLYKVVALESYMHTEIKKFCKTRETIDFHWHGKHITDPGTYEDRQLAKNGCDSIERLMVSYYPLSYTILHDTMCPHEKYLFKGKFMDSAGVYRDTIGGEKCDTIKELRLAYWPVYKDTIYDTICDNQYYYIAGQKIKPEKDTFVEIHLQTIHNCDSAIYLYLAVWPTFYAEKHYEICPNQSIKIKDTILTFSMHDPRASHPYLYNDTMNTIHGCDSVEQYIITVHPSYLFLQNIVRCANDIYLWVDNNGSEHYITQSGIYADTLKSKFGCDSIIGIKFTQVPTYNIHIFDTVWCSNDDYVWRRNERLTESGVYVDSLKSFDGCDSVVTLHLTVYRPYLIRRRDTICENETYWFRGHYYNTSGVYYDSAKTWFGCDSTIMLELHVIPVIRDTFTDTICFGEKLIWGNQLCKSTGEYFDTVYTPGKLYCHINVLYLIVLSKRDSRLQFDSIADICADVDSFDIVTRHQGYKPTRFCLLFDQKAKEQGFKDLMYKNYIPKITYPMPKRFNSYVYPDWYTITYKAYYDECNPDIDEYKIKFRILYPSWIIEQNWNDVVALRNTAHNGGFTFDNYVWYVNDRIVAEMTGTNLYYENLNEGDEVYLIPTRLGDDYAIPTCPITIKPYSDDANTYVAILIYPTIISKLNARVNVESPIDGHYSIFDMYGHRIADADYRGGENFNVQFPDVPGCYLLYVETVTGKKKSTKIMVY